MKIADKVDSSHKKEPKIEHSPSLRGHYRYKWSMYPCVPSQIQRLVLCLMRETRKYSQRGRYFTKVIHQNSDLFGGGSHLYDNSENII